jgi:FkbM family methyltransferase
MYSSESLIERESVADKTYHRWAQMSLNVTHGEPVPFASETGAPSASVQRSASLATVEPITRSMGHTNDWLRGRLERLGFVAHRWPTTRFNGMAEALTLLKQRDYRPKVIVDCGANVGQWMTQAKAVFPDAEWHLVEPQAACVAQLRSLVAATGRAVIHPFAVTAPGPATLRMLGGGDGTGTGNFVALADETYSDERTVEATTLDRLLGDRLERSDRTLLKLDVEQHEIEVLEGAAQILRLVEVVLTEVSVYDVTGRRPTFSDVLEYLHRRGFEFYDVACLSSRPRDKRLRQMDVIFIRGDSALLSDRDWA